MRAKRSKRKLKVIEVGQSKGRPDSRKVNMWSIIKNHMNAETSNTKKKTNNTSVTGIIGSDKGQLVPYKEFYKKARLPKGFILTSIRLIGNKLILNLQQYDRKNDYITITEQHVLVVKDKNFLNNFTELEYPSFDIVYKNSWDERECFVKI